MWLKAQNEMAGLLPHAAMGPVERMVRPHRSTRCHELCLAHSANVRAQYLSGAAGRQIWKTSGTVGLP